MNHAIGRLLVGSLGLLVVVALTVGCEEKKPEDYDVTVYEEKYDGQGTPNVHQPTFTLIEDDEIFTSSAAAPIPVATPDETPDETPETPEPTEPSDPKADDDSSSTFDEI